jgi:uncharacterized membrane protein AbrB (regulator of aidB expression)
MNYFKLVMALLALFILFYVIYPGEVHAYIDPGTGSIMLQVLIGILFGLLFSLKMFWKRIKSFFKRLFSVGSGSGKKEG